MIYITVPFYIHQTTMELNIDDEWSEFLSFPNNEEYNNISQAIKSDNTAVTECPKASEIYISTKTNIAFLNTSIDLKTVFWKIPIIAYGIPIEGVVKKQMKFNSLTQEDLKEVQDNLKSYTCVEQNVITSIDNPSGRIKFKDIRKVSIGLCKKDLISYRSKKKSAFYNCFVIIIRLLENESFKEYHCKIFNTGKLEIPGIQSEETFEKILIFVTDLLNKYTETKVKVQNEKTHTVLINSNFNCGFFINRELLFNILKVNYKLDCIYDPCSYPGIQCKFFYYKGLAEQKGIQQPNLPDETEVSFMIFRTGSVLIVGKCDESVLRNIYEFLKILLSEEFKNIGIKIIDSTTNNKPKNTKTRKKIISV